MRNINLIDAALKTEDYNPSLLRGAGRRDEFIRVRLPNPDDPPLVAKARKVLRMFSSKSLRGTYRLATKVIHSKDPERQFPHANDAFDRALGTQQRAEPPEQSGGAPEIGGWGRASGARAHRSVKSSAPAYQLNVNIRRIYAELERAAEEKEAAEKAVDKAEARIQELANELVKKQKMRDYAVYAWGLKYAERLRRGRVHATFPEDEIRMAAEEAIQRIHAEAEQAVRALGDTA
jgi:hypothetical protein